jgi:hypothetical protein
MTNNEVLVIDNIKSKIHTIRGIQVIIDRDLAELYEVETKRINEQVKRNRDRFPSDFCFKLNKEEQGKILRSQFATSSLDWGGIRYIPYAFTEQGIAMLSGILKSKKAIEINIRIMRAFILMRKFLIKNVDFIQKIDTIERKQLKYQIKTDDKFDKVFDLLETKKPKQGIFYNGQIFTAYKFVCDLVKSAKTSIILIDNYIDESVLELFTKESENVKIKIYTKDVLKLDVKKYNEQYNNIELKKFSLSHDRFLIIDEKEIFHIGASLKDLGKRWFGFSKFDKNSINLIQRLNSLED